MTDCIAYYESDDCMNNADVSYFIYRVPFIFMNNRRGQTGIMKAGEQVSSIQSIYFGFLLSQE